MRPGFLLWLWLPKLCSSLLSSASPLPNSNILLVTFEEGSLTIILVSWAAKTNYHTLSGFKQGKLILSQVRSLKSGVSSGGTFQML